MYVIDSYAWIEYFSGTTPGKLVKSMVEGEDDVYTPSIVVAEIKRKLLREMRAGRETKEGMKGRVEFIRLKSLTAGLDADTAERAAELADELSLERKGFGLADGIVLATARKLGAMVVTGDAHFKGLKDVVFIKG